MWKSFKNNDNLYLANLVEVEDQFKISITDLTTLWQAELSLKDLVEVFKETNPLIEASPTIVKDNILDLFENISKHKIKIENQEDKLQIIIEQNCGELTQQNVAESIVYKFVLSKKSENEFKNEISIPLIQTVHILEEQQMMLLTLIKNKDRELQEYSMEKGEISRADLKTEPFNSETIQTKNHRLFLGTFLKSNSGEFLELFRQQNGEIELPNLGIGGEPWNQIKKRKKVYNSKTVVKKGSGVKYGSKK